MWVMRVRGLLVWICKLRIIFNLILELTRTNQRVLIEECTASPSFIRHRLHEVGCSFSSWHRHGRGKNVTMSTEKTEPSLYPAKLFRERKKERKKEKRKLGFFSYGHCWSLRTSPPPPLEWNSFLPLVTAVLITFEGAESPGSHRVGVIGALVLILPSETIY